MKSNRKVRSVSSLNWDTRYAELKSYCEMFGNPHVPQNSKQFKQLSIWVANQRSQYKKGNLSQDKIDRLNEIGFRWSARGTVPKTTDCSWDDYMDALVRFKATYGHDLIPVPYRDGKVPLGNWISNMRRMRNRGDLSDAKISALNSVNFAWDSKESAWNLRYNELKEIYLLNGDSSVPVDEKGKEYEHCHNYLKLGLGEWVAKQRLLKKRGELSPEKIALLDELEFDWTGVKHYKIQYKWTEFYNRLKTKENVNFTVFDETHEDYDLYEWCVVQRLRFQKGQLKASRLALLKEIGFKFHVKEIGYNQHWLNKYNLYKEFLECEGFENRKKLRKENQTLINWADFQRRKYKNNQLEAPKIEFLNDINFKWEVRSK